MARTRLFAYAAFALTLVALPVQLRAVASRPLDLNRASLEELLEFKGIGRLYAEKIIRGRPYHSRSELVGRNILPVSTYLAIKNDLFASPVADESGLSRELKPVPVGSVDLNLATRDELTRVHGIGQAYADKIIRGRPYRRPLELVGRRIMPLAAFEQIEDRIVVRD